MVAESLAWAEFVCRRLSTPSREPVRVLPVPPPSYARLQVRLLGTGIDGAKRGGY